MRKGVIGSATLHAGILIASVVAWPHAFDFSDQTPPAIPVELVSVADATNIMASVTKEEAQKPPPEDQTPPAEQQEDTTAAPPPEQAEAAPRELDPTRAKPLPKPDMPTEEAAATPPKTPPPAPKMKPKPDAKPQDKFDVDSIVALLDKRAPKSAPPANARVAETTIKGLGAQSALTMDIKDALLAQMRECWNVPAGAPDPEKLIVSVHVYLARDGSLARPPELSVASRSGASSDPYMRAAAENALRAVNVCEPYHNLPADKYDTWREFDMIFDPSKMVGR